MDLKTNVVFSGPNAKLVYDLLMTPKSEKSSSEKKRKDRSDLFLKSINKSK